MIRTGRGPTTYMKEIEVTDSPDGILPSSQSLANLSPHSGREATIRGFLEFWGCGERYWKMGTGVLLRISFLTLRA